MKLLKGTGIVGSQDDLLKTKQVVLMKKVPGQPLDQVQFRNKAQAIRAIHRSEDALQKLHDKGVVHGDPHMGNIMYDKKTNKAQFVDFGFADVSPTEHSKEYDMQELNRHSMAYLGDFQKWTGRSGINPSTGHAIRVSAGQKPKVRKINRIGQRDTTDSPPSTPLNQPIQSQNRPDSPFAGLDLPPFD